MKILVINCGSSSIKFQLLDMTDETVLASGLLERIGEPEARFHLKTRTDTRQTVDQARRIENHHAGMAHLFSALNAQGVLGPLDALKAIGHRVVHGGEHFNAPTRLDSASLEQIRATIPLAPLHNPANLAGIEACQALFPDLPQIAVFDTAFHQDMPERAWRYALPDAWYRDYGVRRYGFHGSSHAYVAASAAEYLGKPLAACNLITLHLGNGASIAAIQNGRCIDTSMGMTPLEGLVMGTRCGDIDPAIPAYMERVAGMTPQTVDSALNHDSGLKALCGDNDMRAILLRAEAGDTQAERALDLYAYRIRKYIGAYLAALGRVDALVFTGGVGENAAPVRARICAGLENLGIHLDPQRNQAKIEYTQAIQPPDAPIALLVIRTNEELHIARQTRAALLP